MAEAMMRRLCLLMLVAAGMASAQDSGLADPTRPPASLSAPAPSGQASAPAASAGPQVQSILISLRPGGRRVAVIDGKTLRQGQRINGALVEAINPTEVVLLKGNQRQILKLYRPAARGAAT
ncbi:MAG: MSHA biogenesis protein MshK [Pseudomonadota bacterium]